MPGNELRKLVVSGSVPDNPTYHSANYIAKVIEGGIAAGRAASTGSRVALSGDIGLGTLGIGGLSGGAALPASLAAGSALATYQFVLSRNDRLGLYRYFSRCFVSPDVPITYGDGTTKKLGDVQPGDKLINALGDVTEVDKRTESHYEGKVVTIRPVGLAKKIDLKVTPEHPFYILRKEKIKRVTYENKKHVPTRIDIDFDPEWVEAKDIHPGDCLIVPGSKEQSEDISVEEARILGYYLAEGNSMRDRRYPEQKLTGVTWTLGSHEENLAEEICSLVESITGDRPKRYGPYQGRESTITIRTIRSNSRHRELVNWLVEHGGEGSRKKKLSRDIFNLPTESAKHLIACWLNGDGCRNRTHCEGQISGTTCSQDLGNQLYLMLVRLDMTPAKYEGRSTRKGEDKGPNWTIFIPAQRANLIAGYYKWEVVEKNHFRHRKYSVDGNMLVPVRKIEFSYYEGTIYNLQTKGENYDERTFLAYGFATHNTDPYVSRSIKLHTELPLSRMSLGAPDGPSSKENREINRIYENMVRRLGLFEFILDMRRESLITGDAFVWCTWDEDIMEFTDLYLLPTEYIHCLLHPYIRRKEIIIFNRPIVGTASLRTMTDRDLFFLAGDPDIQPLLDDLDEDVPEELRSLLDYGEGHALNTDPRKGSFCFHYKLNPTSTEAYGSSIIESVLESLLRSENLKNANLNITQRNMNPKHLIIAENASQDELDSVRTQIDLSFLEPMDFPIIANFPITWQIIGPNDRLLQAESEYSIIKQQLMAGLGVTEEMLTGAATYGGSRFTMELLNTQYLNDRTRIIEFIEEYLFQPVAEAHGHFYHEKIPCWIKIDPEDLRAGDEVLQDERDGVLRKKVYKFEKSYNHSRIRFNRLSVRDNAEVYDQLFQLHQKGSLDLRYLLELHNIDPEENANAMLESLGTPRDPMFNRVLEGFYGHMGDYVFENTDLKDRVVKSMNLDKVSKARGEAAPGTPSDMTQTGGAADMGFDTGFGGGFSPVPGGAPPGGEGDLFGGEEAGAGLPGEPVTVGEGTAPPTETVSSLRLPGKRLTATQVKKIVEASEKRGALTKNEVREIITAHAPRKKDSKK